MNTTTTSCLLLIVLTACPLVCRAQPVRKDKDSASGPAPARKLADLKFKHQSFTFVRIKYSGDGAARSQSWSIDYPGSDLNFTARIQKETGLKCERDGKVMALTDAELKRYPFIYIVEGGQIRLTDAEVVSLRKYLLGGGFLMVDDFWGEDDWQRFSMQMKRAFPEREPVELNIDHPIFHSYYEIREKPQVPNVMTGIRSQFTGVTWEREDAKEPHYRGLFDDNGRMMAVFCHNTDLGDGWEREGDNDYYFREFSLKKAYPMGINIVVYALTQ